MKSIIQEASSVAKAVEQGLLKAGNPRDFSVKILELPEKNFFGLTTKPAKIALYYDERSPRKPEVRPERPPRDQRQPQRSGEHRASGHHEQPSHEGRRDGGNVHQRPLGNKPNKVSPTHEEQPGREEVPLVSRWTPEILAFSETWLQKILVGMERSVPFRAEINNLCLRIVFEEPLFDNPEKERRVLASLSLLLLETAKHTFKVNLRGHKVVLTHRPTS